MIDEEIKRLRIERLNLAVNRCSLKRKDIAEKVSISQATLTQYLQGKYLPKSDKIEVLSKTLGVSERWLKGENVPMRRLLGGFQIVKQLEEKGLGHLIMNDNEIYDMELQQTKLEFQEKVDNLTDNQIYNLVDIFDDLSTIDKKDWELLVAFNHLTDEGKDKLLDYANILNEIPRLLEIMEDEEN